MDHVLIDVETKRMLGRGGLLECETARAQLKGNEHIVYCAEAKGFSAYSYADLCAFWLTAKGWQHDPCVDYGTMCRAIQAAAQLVGPISLYLSSMGANDMSNATERNGVKWPQRGASARVFEIAQSISTHKQDFATKEEVVAAATAEGINEGTAATQYSAWRRYWADPSEVQQQPVAPVAPIAPAAPIAPTLAQPSPAHAVAEVVHQAQQQFAPAPAAFTPPAAPAFAAPAPAAPQQFAQPGSTPFQQPQQAQEVAIGAQGAPEPKQRVAVEVGMHVSVNLQPCITKLEQLLQTLKDAQADFGD